jgi:hypothetical protein
MAIVLRKAGSTTPVKINPPSLPIPKDDGFKSPFRESFHDDNPAPAVEATPPPPVQKPKAVFKILGGRPIKPAPHTVTPPPTHAKDAPGDLAASAGLAEEDPRAESLRRWPPAPIGTRVIITNSMFPWVKHYKPGDECIVESIPPNLTLAEDPWKYKSHLLRIVSPDSPRKGHTIMLLRWEFEPVGDKRLKTPECRVITQS